MFARIIFSVFLILHALVHVSFLTPKPLVKPSEPGKPAGPAWPFDLDKSIILTPLGVSSNVTNIIGTVLVIIILAGFILAALGWLGMPLLKSIRIPITYISSGASIILLVLFWNSWFILGPIIDIAIMILTYKGIIK